MNRQFMNGLKAVGALALSTLVIVGCGSQAGSGKPPVTSGAEGDVIEGTLVEARCYFNTGAVGGDHTFCAFQSAKANLPIGILTARGQFIFLTSVPAHLATHMAKQVRARGNLTPNHQLLRPISMQVAKGDDFVDIEI